MRFVGLVLLIAAGVAIGVAAAPLAWPVLGIAGLCVALVLLLALLQFAAWRIDVAMLPISTRVRPWIDRLDAWVSPRIPRWVVRHPALAMFLFVYCPAAFGILAWLIWWP